MDPSVTYEVVAHHEEVVHSGVISNSSGSVNNPFRLEVDEDPEQHHAITTIQLQSPGGSSHIVEGLMVTTSSQIPGQSHLVQKIR